MKISKVVEERVMSTEYEISFETELTSISIEVNFNSICFDRKNGYKKLFFMDNEAVKVNCLINPYIHEEEKQTAKSENQKKYIIFNFLKNNSGKFNFEFDLNWEQFKSLNLNQVGDKKLFEVSF